MVSGAILALVWLVLSIVPALLRGIVPIEVASYTTFITGAVDIGIVAPALILSGTLLFRNAPVGYLLASMLVFTMTLGTSLLVAGITQIVTEVVAMGQFLGFTVPFAILTLIAIWLTIILFRACSNATRDQTVSVEVAQV